MTNPRVTRKRFRTVRKLVDSVELRRWWRVAESNRRHYDFQSYALPTELPRHSRETARRGTKSITRQVGPPEGGHHYAVSTVNGCGCLPSISFTPSSSAACAATTTLPLRS